MSAKSSKEPLLSHTPETIADGQMMSSEEFMKYLASAPCQGCITYSQPGMKLTKPKKVPIAPLLPKP